MSHKARPEPEAVWGHLQLATVSYSSMIFTEAFFLRVLELVSPLSSPAVLNVLGGGLSDEKRAHLPLSSASFTDESHLISWKMRRQHWDRPLVVSERK